jgi:hypothetical protein
VTVIKLCVETSIRRCMHTVLMVCIFAKHQQLSSVVGRHTKGASNIVKRQLFDACTTSSYFCCLLARHMTLLSHETHEGCLCSQTEAKLSIFST